MGVYSFSFDIQIAVKETTSVKISVPRRSINNIVIINFIFYSNNEGFIVDFL